MQQGRFFLGIQLCDAFDKPISRPQIRIRSTETKVSHWGNFIFPLWKLLFPTGETFVAHVGNNAHHRWSETKRTIFRPKPIVNPEMKCKLNFAIAKNTKQMFPISKEELSLFRK
ncbi:hypothetical protein HMPREF1981_02468 [Bacteroides pyogenes F0041]|uniref:Uncharacterized protein n=1 Tax=Bacteroides pyogenes F0041 TaxID=1321819 RepID=U2C118_9BACE|nr:hypothetical protein HMPREF1981_02468 [Bacteroides pyogenes F0041]